jgi:anti-sigma factor RsiW
VRDREMDRVLAQNPDLDERVAHWRAGHPSGTLEQAVRDLNLWHKPADKDAQAIIWTMLRQRKDPAAMQGFHVMRNATAAGAGHIPAVRDAAPPRSSPRNGTATGRAAGMPRPGEGMP